MFEIGEDGGEWGGRYKEAVLREPIMPGTDCRREVVGVGGSKVEEHEERKEYMIQLTSIQKMQKEKCVVM